MPSTSRAQTAIVILAIVAVIIAIVLVMISVFRTSNADRYLRIAVRSEGGADSVNVTGVITLDSAAFGIGYDLYYTPPSSTLITSLIVKGPIPVGSDVGPTAFSLCGPPNLEEGCDLVTLPGRVTTPGGNLLMTLYPGGLSALPMIQNLRRDLHRYYLCVVTTDYPDVNNCVVRAPFLATLGTE